MWRVEHSGQPAQITAIFDSYGLYQTSPVSPWKSYWSYTFTPKEVTHWVRLRQKDIRIRANSIFIKKEKFGSVCASDFKFHITLAVCGQQSYLRPSRNRRQLRCCGIQSAFCCNILDLIITNQTIVSEILLFIPVVIKLHQTTLHSLSTCLPPKHHTLAMCQSMFMIIPKLITTDSAPTSLHVFCCKMFNQCGMQSKVLSVKVWPSSSPK